MSEVDLFWRRVFVAAVSNPAICEGSSGSVVAEVAARVADESLGQYCERIRNTDNETGDGAEVPPVPDQGGMATGGAGAPAEGSSITIRDRAAPVKKDPPWADIVREELSEVD